MKGVHVRNVLDVAGLHCVMGSVEQAEKHSLSETNTETDETRKEYGNMHSRMN